MITILPHGCKQHTRYEGDDMKRLYQKQLQDKKITKVPFSLTETEVASKIKTFLIDLEMKHANPVMTHI